MVYIKKYSILFMGVAILAFGMFNIHNRTNITEGGVLGAILLLENWFMISPSISNIILDGTCYILGYKYLGKQFLIDAFISTIAFSIFYRFFESVGYLIPDLTNMPLVASICGALCVGIGVGLVVRKGGACGGDDALALVISKVFNIKISKAYMLTDFTVLILSLTYIPLNKIIYSLITVTISSFLIEKVKEYEKSV